MLIKYSIAVAGIALSGLASAACDVSLVDTHTNNQIVLKAACTGGPISGINWLRDGNSVGASTFGSPVPDGSFVYTTTPALSGTSQYTATGATGAHSPTTADVPAGIAVTVFTPQPVLTAAPTAGGTIVSSPAGISACTSGSGTCTASFDSGITVTLTASADGSHSFSGWSGDCTGTATVCAVNMTSNKTVSANFGPSPQAGLCGSANGSTAISAAPAGAAACNPGTISGLSDPGTAAQGNYTWTCTGLNGGATSGHCSAPKLVNGGCGSANGGSGLTSAPTGTAACATGSVTNMVAATQSPYNFTWNCAGFNGGTTSTQCSAGMASTPGACGSANNTNVTAAPTGTAACSTGTISGMTNPSQAGGDYNWTCAGLAGGASSGTCTAHQKVNGACGSANGVSVSSAPTTNLCVAGNTPTTVSGSGPWTWGCNGANGGTNTSATACSAPKTAADACGAVPGNFVVVEPNGSAYGGTWKPDTSGMVFTSQLPPGAGAALKFSVNTTTYPKGFKLIDATGGTTSYVVSRCPGSTTPVDGQDGSISVNGDAYKDTCSVINGYGRWVDTSGSSKVYYTGSGLSYQKTCFLPTTTALGSGTTATYYVNITNNSPTAATGTQFSLMGQLN